MKVSDIGRRVLETRYLLKDTSNNLIETPEELVKRVALGIGRAELTHIDAVGTDKARANEASFVEECERWLSELSFLPNSPTLMNANIPDGQLSACFVLPVADDIGSIFDAVKQMALIFKSGGGVGLPMSRLRPRNDLVKTTGGVSSGPVSFMRVYNTTAEVVAQGGKRRGALMGTLRVDHPDIMEFITVKQDLTQLTSFNLSVAITDEFMQALASGDTYPLVNPRTGAMQTMVPAQDVWDAIVDCAWRTGEPGLIFIDRMNEKHYALTGATGVIEGTNPCGEIPLMAYESCNLGSINLANFVTNPFTKDASVDYDGLQRVTAFAVRFLDNVVTVNTYPIHKIREATLKTRKVGLGVMGFAEMLIQLGVRYGTEQSRQVLGQVLRHMQTWSHAVSVELADERGPYPDGGIARKRRNATLTAIAPTGSISMIAGVTGGIEPMFSVVTRRESVLDGKPFLQVNETVRQLLACRGFEKGKLDRVLDEVASGKPIEEIIDDTCVVCAHEVSPEDHVLMQAEAQGWIDNAVSKTVNLPHDAEHVDIYGIFCRAYEAGCKGITVYRDGCREHQPMSAPAAPADEGVEQLATPAVGAELLDGDLVGEGSAEIVNSGMTWDQVLARLNRLGISPPPLLDANPMVSDVREREARSTHVVPGKPFETQIELPVLLQEPGQHTVHVDDQGQIVEWEHREPDGSYDRGNKLHMQERPDTLPGHTVKMKTGCGTLFVTVSTDENGNPVELFAHHGKAGICSAAQCEAIGRLSSMSLRSGIDPQEVIDQLRGITCHETSGMGPNKVLSCADGIAKAIAKALAAVKGGAGAEEVDDPEATRRTRPVYMGACPKCGSGTVREAGCIVCKTCGWEKCS